MDRKTCRAIDDDNALKWKVCECGDMQTWGKGFADGQGYEYLYYKMDAILVEIWCHSIPQYLTQSPTYVQAQSAQGYAVIA